MNALGKEGGDLVKATAVQSMAMSEEYIKEKDSWWLLYRGY